MTPLWRHVRGLLLLTLWLFGTAIGHGAGPVEPLAISCAVGYTPSIYATGLSGPDGLALSPDGALYVAEEKAGQVSRIEPDGTHALVLAGLRSPEGITFDESGNLYVVEDVSNGRLIRMDTQGITTTLAADLVAPEGVAWASGRLFVTESNAQLVQSSPLSLKSWVREIADGGSERSEAQPTSLIPQSYAGITVGPDGLLYITNELSGVRVNDSFTFPKSSIYTYNPATNAHALWLAGEDVLTPEGLRFAAGGFPLYVVEESQGQLSRISQGKSTTTLCEGFTVNGSGSMEDVVVDGDGNLFVSEDSTGRIIKIAPPAVPPPTETPTTTPTQTPGPTATPGPPAPVYRAWLPLMQSP